MEAARGKCRYLCEGKVQVMGIKLNTVFINQLFAFMNPILAVLTMYEIAVMACEFKSTFQNLRVAPFQDDDYFDDGAPLIVDDDYYGDCLIVGWADSCKNVLGPLFACVLAVPTLIILRAAMKAKHGTFGTIRYCAEIVKLKRSKVYKYCVKSMFALCICQITYSFYVVNEYMANSPYAFSLLLPGFNACTMMKEMYSECEAETLPLGDDCQEIVIMSGRFAFAKAPEVAADIFNEALLKYLITGKDDDLKTILSEGDMAILQKKVQPVNTIALASTDERASEQDPLQV